MLPVSRSTRERSTSTRLHGPGEPVTAYVRRLAAEKSARASRLLGPSEAGIVLSADTAVVIDGEILGKPRDDHEAYAMLRRLAGRRHQVMTGLSVRMDAHELGRVETTGVHFAPMTDADVTWYVESGEGRDKAGAYAIQGLASRFIPRIEGSYSNVVGLPVAAVVELLREFDPTLHPRGSRAILGP